MSITRSTRYGTWLTQRVNSRLEGLTEAAKGNQSLRDAYDAELTSHGNSEEKIARSHEGRELIELIQNARDAIQPSGPGQVYVGILDEGILVANTGKPFDLLDEDTERAVKMIGESNKTDLEDDDTAGVDMDSDSVGHIGVGLKSTVAVGDDFEVWSRRPGDSEPLRVRYSRAYITAAVAARFGHQLPTKLDLDDGLIGPYAEAAANGLFDPHQQFVDDPIPLKDDLGKAPLFWFPWPLDPSSPGPSNSTLADRANKLLTAPQETLSQFAEPPSNPFRTAVFVEYRDDMWRTLLSAFDIPTPIESPDDPAARADELWEKLSYYGDRAEGFDPETLINLGKIDDLYLERIPQESANETEHWDVTETTPQRTIPDSEVKHRKFDVKISTDSGAQTVTYDSYAGEWDGTETTRPRLVIERPRTDADGIARASYPLHLYYPISATDDALPVCFHGRFRVTTERKDLSRSSAEHNRRVFKHGAELFGRVGAGTATLACDSEAAYHWNRYPWLLLPDTGTEMDRVPESPKDTADLIAYFRRQIVEELRNAAAVPTINGPTAVDSITLYPSKPVFKSFAAAAEISDTSGTTALTPGENPIPTSETLRAALTLQSKRGDLERQRQRWEAFVGTERATATLKDWAHWLNSNLTVDESSSSNTGASTRIVDHRRGKELFGGVVELVDKAATEKDTSVANVLKEDWLADMLPGVYLLPCERAERDETVEIVPVEPSPSGQIDRGTQSTRTVFWGLDRETLPFSYPPEHGEFDVFFFDQESQRGATEVLSDAGKTRTWGVREYNDLPDMFEALLQTFKPPTRDLDLGSVAALATLVSNLEVDSATLGQTELSVGSRSHFVNALSNTDRRSLLRLRLGVRRSTISGPTFPDTKLSDFSLSDSWQQLRHKALQAATTDSGAEADSNPLEEPEWKATGDFDATSLPDPTQDADAWTGFPEDLTETDTRRGLARAISLLGVSSLPGIRYLPFHGETHPPVNEGIPHWHPSEWIDEGLPTWAVNHRESLRSAVETTNYTQYITSYNHHPRATINHLGCEKAPTTADSSHQQSYLIGWTWFDPVQLAILESNPERARALLERYSNEYRQNLLTTKWHCRRYNGCSIRDATVPTVANLQLRQLPIWDSIVKVTDSLEDQQAWESEQPQLSYTVIQTEGGGRSGWRLFPHIDPDDEDVLLSESLLAEFGVVPLSEIDVTGAEHRLQQVQTVLADVSADEFREIDEPVPLSIPPSQVENWKRAYSQLLRPILDSWDTPDDADAVDAKLDELLSTLTHIPLKREGEWYTASIEWVRDHGGSAVWRYPRENPTRWVKTALSTAYEGQPGYRFEHPVQQTGFAEFADKALDIPSISATEPQLSAEEFNARKRPTTEFISRSKLQNWTDTLQTRLPLLLATISARSHNRLESATETLRAGINNIAVIERLPADIRADLSDPKSVTYLLPDEVESNGEQARGIAVVASEVDSPAIGDLTQAIALLTKQFGHLGTIQHVLEADEYTQARRRLEGTFPVEDAEQFLEERRRTNLRNRLELAADLLDWLGYQRPPVEGAAKQLQEQSNEETDLFERLSNDVRGGDELSGLPEELQTYLNRCRSVDRSIREIIALLFNPGSEGVSTIREHITALSSGDRKQALIEWFAVHSRELPGDFVPSEIASQCRRLSQIDAVWVETDSEFVQSPVDWHNAVEEKETTLAWHEELPEYASTEDFGTYWLDLCKDDRATALADRLHSQLTNELPDHTAAAVRAYIIDGEPLPSPTESSPDHKERAFASATNYLRENEISSLEIIDDESVSASVAPDSSDSTTATGGTGGQPQSFTGRGELAEVAVTLEILTRTAAWLEADAEHEDILIDQFKDLYQTQTKDGDDAIDYKWHTEGRWNRDLLPLLNQDSEQLLNEFINWQSTIPTSGSLVDLASVSLLDVSGEQGPGFDIIDPVTRDGTSFSPRPVEIKSVATTNPPFNIRLSTNEYQQCKLHVSQSDHPYILRIIYVPSDDPTIAASKDVATYQITSVDELRTLVGEPFDMQVRSGYLRPTLDEK